MKSIVKKACENGDKVVVTFTAVNSGTSSCTNVVGDIIVPTGLRLNKRASVTSEGGITPTYDVGAFNPTTEKWTIGTLLGGEQQAILTEFEVTDETKFALTDFIVEFVITSSCVEDSSDNKVWLIIDKDCPVEVDPEQCDQVKVIVS